MQAPSSSRRSADDPYTDEQIAEFGLRPDRLARHVAVIMDGNGRWANSRGLPRIEGHRRGVGTVRAIVEQCSRLGLDQLTLYCFSSENWKRPPLELKLLMQLFEQYLIEERSEIIRQNLQFAVIGRREGLGDGVLRVLSDSERGLFPKPKEIHLSCSCPDWASMCKHVAAVLYGIGARLDEQPHLLFTLRNVDEKDLIAKAGKGLPLSSQSPKTGRVLKDTELADVFGIEMAGITEPLTKKKAARKIRQKPTTKSAKKNAPKARKPRVKA